MEKADNSVNGMEVNMELFALTIYESLAVK